MTGRALMGYIVNKHELQYLRKFYMKKIEFFCNVELLALKRDVNKWLSKNHLKIIYKVEYIPLKIHKYKTGEITKKYEYQYHYQVFIYYEEHIPNSK
mgnify:CR=1 FL=1